MTRFRFWGTALATVVVLALPFIGGAGPGLATTAYADAASVPTHRAHGVITSETSTGPVGTAGVASGTLERRASAAAAGLACPAAIGGTARTVTPGAYTASGVGGTTQADLAQFAAAYNTIRVENCLQPIPFANFTYDSCMEQRLFWMAEDPSEDPASAWGHLGSERSDGVPSVGCDGNLAGGTDNTGSTVAYKWWVSDAHRESLYKPGAEIDDVCIAFAMSHGGIPNEPYPFTRAAARWYHCA